jgi:hypothetical protein
MPIIYGIQFFQIYCTDFQSESDLNFSFLFSFFYCFAGRGFIVAFTEVLTTYQVYYPWIHLLHHSPLSSPSTTARIVSTDLIFPFTYMCTQLEMSQGNYLCKSLKQTKMSFHFFFYKMREKEGRTSSVYGGCTSGRWEEVGRGCSRMNLVILTFPWKQKWSRIAHNFLKKENGVENIYCHITICTIK